MIPIDVVVMGNLVTEHFQQCSSMKPGSKQPGFHSYRRVAGAAGFAQCLANTDRNLKIKLMGQIARDDNGVFLKHEIQNTPATGASLRTDIAETSYGSTSSFTRIKTTTEETVLFNWGVCTKRFQFKVEEAKWLHICYLDALDYISESNIMNFSGTVSADIFHESHTEQNKNKILSMMPYIDFLLATPESINSLGGKADLLQSLKHLHKKEDGVIIVNQGDAALVFNGSTSSLVANHRIKKELSPKFSAQFVYDQLCGGKYIDSVKEAFR